MKSLWEFRKIYIPLPSGPIGGCRDAKGGGIAQEALLGSAFQQPYEETGLRREFCEVGGGSATRTRNARAGNAPKEEYPREREEP